MKPVSGRIVVAVVLIVIAAFVALDAFLPGAVLQQVGSFASMWWPVALVVIGLVGLLSGGSFAFNLILALAGLWFLAGKLAFLHLAEIQDKLFLPFVLLVIAVLVLVSAFRGRRPATRPADRAQGTPGAAPGAAPDSAPGPAPSGSAASHASAGPDDHVHVFSAFSGHDARCASQAFRYAEVFALFGGSSLDLRSAALAPEGAHVELTALFGGADVIVPEGWAVEVSSTPIFGGVDNRTSNPAGGAPGQPVLHVNATAVFGGAAIKNRPDRERP